MIIENFKTVVLSFNQIRKLDWILVITVLLLLTVGLLSIYSITKDTEKFGSFKKQLVFAVIGISLIIGLAFFNYQIFKNHNLILLAFYFLSLLLLAAVLFFGREIRGTYSWFHFKGLSFEPVELAKLVVILVLAKYFSLRHIEMYRLRHVVVSGLYVFVPFLLVFLQPDPGSALILLAIWLGMVIVSGIKLRHLFILFLIGLIVFGASWLFLLKDYQKQRIVTFLNPYLDPLGEGYQVIQSTIAVGAGGLWGRGLGHGSQSQLDFLPEQHTDFIFASIAEEWGFLGVIFVLALFLILFYRILKIGIGATNNFSRLFSFGVAIMLLSQLFINIGMNIGFFPVIGIPLPLVSYGGSNLVLICIALGLLQSIKARSG